MSTPPKGGARARLRAHFLNNVGRVMGSAELREVAGGISEWARRIRELRTEEGYMILTHNDLASLKPGQYLLRDPKPQPAFERSISRKPGLLSWIVTALPASNAGLWRENRTLMIRHARRVCKSAM